MGLDKIVTSKKGLEYVINPNPNDSKNLLYEFKQLKKLDQSLDIFFDNFYLSFKSDNVRIYAKVKSHGEIILHPTTDDSFIYTHFRNPNPINKGILKEDDIHYSNVQIGEIKIKIYQDYSFYLLDNKKSM